MKPAMQREATAAFYLAKKLLDERGDEFGILRLDGLTISDNRTLPDRQTNTLTIARHLGFDDVVMIAIWNDDDPEIFFAEYRTGYWRLIMRRASKTQELVEHGQ